MVVGSVAQFKPDAMEYESSIYYQPTPVSLTSVSTAKHPDCHRCPPQSDPQTVGCAMQQLLPSMLQRNAATFRSLLQVAIDQRSPTCPLDIWRAHLVHGGMKVGSRMGDQAPGCHPPFFVRLESPLEVAKQARAIVNSTTTLVEHGAYLVETIIFQFEIMLGSDMHRPHEAFNALLASLLDTQQAANSNARAAAALLAQMLFNEVERRAWEEHTLPSPLNAHKPLSTLLHVQTYTTAIVACMAHTPTCQAMENVLRLLGNMFAWKDRPEIQPNEWTWTAAVNAALKVCVRFVSWPKDTLCLLGVGQLHSHVFAWLLARALHLPPPCRASSHFRFCGR